MTAAFEAVRVVWRVALDPTVTLPKLRAAGDAASCAVALPVPFPETLMDSGEFSALLPRLIVALCAPGVTGVKITGNWMLVPNGRLIGRGIFPTEKPAPCTEAELRVRVPLAVFESWM